ncbi:MAG TPA: type II toxin-antitoxin system VapB family antitoxin [Methylobacter sp.]|jgi:Arc/MetJ family transcription regulator
MKTSLNLPDELIKEAMQLTDAKTKTKVIVLALQELIKKNKVAGLKSCKGAIDLDIDIDTLRNRNAHFD